MKQINIHLVWSRHNQNPGESSSQPPRARQGCVRGKLKKSGQPMPSDIVLAPQQGQRKAAGPQTEGNAPRSQALECWGSGEKGHTIARFAHGRISQGSQNKQTSKKNLHASTNGKNLRNPGWDSQATGVEDAQISQTGNTCSMSSYCIQDKNQ